MLSFSFFGRIDFSDKNPYVVLAHDANLVSVLEVFARGAHRGACMKPSRCVYETSNKKRGGAQLFNLKCSSKTWKRVVPLQGPTSSA